MAFYDTITEYLLNEWIEEPQYSMVILQLLWEYLLLKKFHLYPVLLECTYRILNLLGGSSVLLIY